MAYRIKTITDADQPRATVTIEETDAGGNPTGREWSEPFDTQKKNWAELKNRFKARIQKDNAKDAQTTTLIDEANLAGLTTIS